jgi:transposase, IS5 family
MRKIFEEQMKLGQVDISHIQFDLQSRDEIPKLLMGLQHKYTHPELQAMVFDRLTGFGWFMFLAQNSFTPKT